MKLIQLNAYNGRLEKPLIWFFKKEQADIICLQEAISIDGEAGLFLPLEGMQEASGLPYAVIGPAFSIRYMARIAKFSNCIFSRLPIQKSEVIFTNLSHKEDYDFVKDRTANMRNFVHAVINIDSQAYNILTHHGYHIPDHKKGDTETLRQMKFLGNYIDELEGPIVLTGDFNLAPNSKSLRHINQRLINLPVKYGLKTTRTSITHRKEVCDYIFINNKVKVENFYASEELVSDHKALILEFEI